MSNRETLHRLWGGASSIVPRAGNGHVTGNVASNRSELSARNASSYGSMMPENCISHWLQAKA